MSTSKFRLSNILPSQTPFCQLRRLNVICPFADMVAALLRVIFQAVPAMKEAVASPAWKATCGDNDLPTHPEPRVQRMRLLTPRLGDRLPDTTTVAMELNEIKDCLLVHDTSFIAPSSPVTYVTNGCSAHSRERLPHGAYEHYGTICSTYVSTMSIMFDRKRADCACVYT